MPEATQIEYKSTLYDIKDAAATAKLNELLNGGDFFKRLANFFFPINHILVRYDGANPRDLYGGEWMELPEGALRNTKNVTLVQTSDGTDTTKITVGQLPSHDHPFTQPTINGKFGAIGAAGNNLYSFWETQGTVNSTTFYATGGGVGKRGNGEDFSLMQKSIYVKAWVRTRLYEG